MSTTAFTQTGLLSTLREEWDTDLADREHDFAGIGVRTCGHLEAEIRSAKRTPAGPEGTGPSEQDRLLHALLAAAHNGDRTAERVVLQFMLPKAVHLARSCRGLRALTINTGTAFDAVSTAIGAAWESIATYPLNRTERVQANLNMDALLIVNKTMRNVDDEENVDTADLEVTLELQGKSTPFEPEWGDSSFHDLVTVLQWAIDAEALTPDEVRILARFDLAEELEERDALAEELGIHRDSLTRKVYRIRVKLIDAVQACVAEHGVLQ